MTPRKIFMNGAVAGSLMIAAAMSLFQDWMGKEAYLKMASDHWWSAKLTVPLALGMLLLGCGVTFVTMIAVKVEDRRF